MHALEMCASKVRRCNCVAPCYLDVLSNSFGRERLEGRRRDAYVLIVKRGRVSGCVNWVAPLGATRLRPSRRSDFPRAQKLFARTRKSLLYVKTLERESLIDAFARKYLLLFLGRRFLFFEMLPG